MSSEDLKRHKRVHTGEKPYCSVQNPSKFCENSQEFASYYNSFYIISDIIHILWASFRLSGAFILKLICDQQHFTLWVFANRIYHRTNHPTHTLELIVLQEVWRVTIAIRLTPRLHQTIEWRWVIYTYVGWNKRIYSLKKIIYKKDLTTHRQIRLYNRYFPHDACSKVQEVTSSKQLTGMQSGV